MEKKVGLAKPPVTVVAEVKTNPDCNEGTEVDFQNSDAHTLWERCKEIIKNNVSRQVFTTWFEPLEVVKYENNQLLIKVGSQFICEWIEEHYYDLMRATISKVIGPDVKLQYEVVLDNSENSLEKRTIKLPAFKKPPSANQPTLEFEAEPSFKLDHSYLLNSRYTFDNFIRGESNQFAWSVAYAISQNPLKSQYNPLFIYGNTGMGKTHLAQAVGNYIISNHRNVRVFYTSMEHFTNDFVSAIRNDKVNDFMAFYRNIDVLIIDDIQFLAGKEKTQDHFFHTFNVLHQTNKQIVLTCDKPQKDLVDIDERLVSRFKWGLTADIKMPDLETRMAILEKKSIDEGFELHPDIIYYIASNVTQSVRELEGCLISLIAKSALDKRPVDMELAMEVVNNITNPGPKPITIDSIKRVVSDFFNLSVDSIVSNSRKREIALARQICIYLCKKFTSLPLKAIGKSFGNRDHSTVLYSCQTVEDLMSTDKNVKLAVEILIKKISAEFSV